MKTGLELITEERVKQIAKYNHTAFNDQCYKNKELLRAALAYLKTAIGSEETLTESWPMEDWPWDISYFKDEGYIENLKKAGAFIAAELDRVQVN
jgi:hypothetical protein